MNPLSTPMLLLVLAVPAAAQVTHGQRLPAIEWTEWPRGAPIVFGEEGPPAVVFALWSAAPSGPVAAGDGAHFAALQARGAAAGLRVVVVASPGQSLAPEWQSCSAATADEAALRTWLGDEGDADWRVVVADRRGRVTFLGNPGEGLEDAVEATLAGRCDLAAEREAFDARRMETFDDEPREHLARLLDRMIAHAPRDGLAAGMRYAFVTQAGGGPVARGEIDRALQVLAGSGPALARFADLALRAEPQARHVAAALAPALAAAARAAPNDVGIALTSLRAQFLAGDAREAGRQVMRVRKLALADAESALAFAEILTHAEPPAAHLDLASEALQRATASGSSSRLLAAVRYAVALRCAGDPAAARAVLDDYAERLNLRVSLNNDCWYYLTELRTLGRADAFALALAERMLEQEAAMDYFEFDTAALAMFRAGRVAEAVRLQEQAIAKGGADDADYQDRLRRYRAAAPPR